MTPSHAAKSALSEPVPFMMLSQASFSGSGLQVLGVPRLWRGVM